jgi:hypothetical protein
MIAIFVFLCRHAHRSPLSGICETGEAVRLEILFLSGTWPWEAAGAHQRQEK